MYENLSQLGLPLFWPQWGSNFRTTGTDTREKGFCIPFIPNYMEKQATPGCLLPVLLVTVGRVRTLLLYCKAPELLVFAPSLWRDDACPRAPASSHSTRRSVHLLSLHSSGQEFWNVARTRLPHLKHL